MQIDWTPARHQRIFLSEVARDRLPGLDVWTSPSIRKVMTNYYRTRRQLYAFLLGGLLALPIAVIAVIVTPSSGPSMDIGHAAHSQLGGILLLLFLALNVGSFVATVLNFVFPIAACVVVGSLAFDAYKISHWRNSKLFAACIGVGSIAPMWYLLQSGSDNLIDLLLARFAPFLGAAFSLTAIFVTLAILRKLGRPEWMARQGR